MNQELKKCLLKEKSGILWYFYISEENRLMYSIKSSGGWSKPAAIDRNLIKYFSAAIDINGRIYVIAYTHTKILIYYEWDGYQWLHKLIHRTQSRFESIPFLSLLSAGQSSHIFYYVENALSKSRETLVHFYLSRYDWDKGPALHFSSDDRVLPLRITSDPNGNIYFIYCQNNSDKYDWHLRILEKSTSVWSPPKFLYQTSSKPENLCIAADSGSVLHLTWPECTDDGFRIMYLRVDNVFAENQEEVFEADEIGESDSSQAVLQIDGTDAYCYWMSGESLHCKAVNSIESDYIVFQNIDDKKIEFFNYFNAKTNNAPVAITAAGVGYPYFDLITPDYIEPKKSKSGLMSVDEDIDGPKRTRKKSSGKAETNGNNIMKAEKAESQKNAGPLFDDILQVKKQIGSLSSRLDELYTSLYIIRDHIAQHNKAIFSLEASVKMLGNRNKALNNQFAAHTGINTGIEGNTIQVKDETGNVSFEPGNSGENMQGIGKVKDYTAAQSEKPYCREVTPEDNDDKDDKSKPEEISLGNISIIINPEDDS